MNVHQNARLTPHSRAELVRRVVVEGQTPTAVAAAFGVTVKTVRKWVARFQTEGVKGLHDRSSRPHHLQSGRIEARTGPRIMPTFPRSPRSFRTAGFPQYGWKAGLSDGAFPDARGLSLLPAYTC